MKKAGPAFGFGSRATSCSPVSIDRTKALFADLRRIWQALRLSLGQPEHGLLYDMMVVVHLLSLAVTWRAAARRVFKSNLRWRLASFSSSTALETLVGCIGTGTGDIQPPVSMVCIEVCLVNRFFRSIFRGSEERNNGVRMDFPNGMCLKMTGHACDIHCC